MKYLIYVFLFILGGEALAYSEQDFTITASGVSNNTNSVFVDVEETANNSECINKKHFKLSVNDQNADRFFSMALAAQAQGKKIRFGYEPTDCLSNAVQPRMIKIVN